MNEAIDVLMHEHRVIEQVLGALRSCAAAAGSQPVSRDDLRDFAEFFRNFADRCHHGKEEDRLFAEMVNRGFSREQGPIAVMLEEHDQGRAHVRAIADIGSGTGPLSDGERRSLTYHAEAFAQLLSAHIMKEDTILYPMSARVLSPADFARLAKEFEEFEKQVMGEGLHEKYHQLADTLVARYGAPANAGNSAACCGHH